MDPLEQRIARLSPAKLALLERKLTKAKPTSRPQSAPTAGSRPKRAPLSFSQERLWFLEQMEPESCAYNLPTIIPLPGPVDPALIEESLLKLVARHSALRTRFVLQDERPYQVISDEAGPALDLATIDLRGASDPRAPRLSRLLNEETWRPFGLAKGALLRARLFLQPDHANFLLVVMHHIVSDGWSLNIFTRELRALYEAGLSGTEPSLPPIPLQYVDYSISQRESLVGDRLDSLVSYWRRQLDGAPSLLGLPLDRPRPARQSYEGALHTFRVPRPSVERLKALCRDTGVVPFMALLAVFKVLLYRYTHEPMIVVGTPIANRNRSELEAVIGFFTNTLVLASSMTAGMSFRELLAQVRETTLGAYEHQDLPFEKLVSEIQPERSLGHNPLFQVMFTFQNLPTDGKAVTEATREDADPAGNVGLDVKLSKFDLTLAMTETAEGLAAVFEYATDLFEAATIERMAVHFVDILGRLVDDPDLRLGGFSFVSPQERTLILEEWNATDRKWPEILPLHGRFERWARRTPAAAALVFGDVELSYRELDRRSNYVAALLRGEGVGKGDIVGISLRRSLEMVVGLYGILKAGAAYMPIEPDLPSGRVEYMLQNAGATTVVGTSDCLGLVAPFGVHTLVLDEIDFEAAVPEPPAVCVDLGPADLAYVLFTSGSSGEPKGVMVSHGAIANRLLWMQERYGLGTEDRVLQKTPFSFDVSVWELFWPLAEGACLVVAEPERHKESFYLVELIEKRRITCLHFVPSMLQLFLHEDLTGCDSLQRIICSGEALTVEQCRRLQELPGVRGHNLYGPTEAAVDVTHWDCEDWRDQYLSVPIGRPIANSQIYILSPQLEPVPIGVAGELHIGGHNLARGYLNKPGLTAKQFIANPFAVEPGARMYKTGDLARFRSDGNVEYVGRIDSQVKLRGLRIELGEIEVLLRRYPGIAEAVVVVHRFAEQDERLVAYVVPEDRGGTVDAGELRAFVGKELPPYMVPAAIVTLDEVPKTRSGKLDRKRLPEPTVPKPVEAKVAPTSDIERELLGLWRKYLKVDTLGIDDDFFLLGGHSLLATQLINSINGRYHLRVSVRLLFERPTIRSLAKALSESEDEAWLDDTQTTALLLGRAPRALLRRLDDLSEEEIDGHLKRYLDGPLLAKFEDGEALVKWARSHPASGGVLSAAGAETPFRAARAVDAAPRPPHSEAQVPRSSFWTHYSQLARIQAEMASLHRVGGGDATNGHATSLRAEGDRVFESFSQEVKGHFATGNGTLPPERLRDLCVQMIYIAHAALPIRVFESDPGGKR